MTTPVAHVLVVSGYAKVRDALVRDLGELITGCPLDLVVANDGVEALQHALRLAGAGETIPVAFIERTLPGAMSGAELALALNTDPVLRRTRCVFVTSRVALSDVDAALARGALNGMLTRPWSEVGIREQFRAQLATYYVEHDPEGLAAFEKLVDSEARRRAAQRIEQRRNAPTQRSLDAGGDGTDHVLLAPHIDEREVERLFIETLDRALGHPPRLRLGAGSVLLEQGSDVGGIYVILEGEVEMRRLSDTGHARIVHHDSGGPIVGLLSLATQRQAFLEVRAVTEVRAIPLSLTQLGRALTAEPDLGVLLTRALVNSLAVRLREADELQVRLEEAQSALIAQARLATLGELAAGIAHELNNPTAALGRAAEHVATDIAELFEPGDPALVVLERARTQEAVRSVDERAARRALTERLGDRALADRLVTAGVHDPAEAERVVRLGEPALRRLSAAHQAGAGLRNLSTASRRIADLVQSLRAYLRGGEQSPFLDGVSVTDTIDDALRLLGHRLADVTVTREYQPLPAVTARPGPLQQVWTNLVANAIDALDSHGAIEIRTTPIEFGTVPGVRVEVIDDGPGIPAEVLEQLFEPHFTTKHGRVAFGSGLGLSISRQIIEEHGGAVTLTSAPGRTVATVELPVRPPHSTSDEPPQHEETTDA